MRDTHDTDVLAQAVGQYYKDQMPLPPAPHGMLDILHMTFGAYVSYGLGIFLTFYGHFQAMLPDIVSWGGFILLIVRLIADGPRAGRTIKEWINGKK